MQPLQRAREGFARWGGREPRRAVVLSHSHRNWSSFSGWICSRPSGPFPPTGAGTPEAGLGSFTSEPARGACDKGCPAPAAFAGASDAAGATAPVVAPTAAAASACCCLSSFASATQGHRLRRARTRISHLSRRVPTQPAIDPRKNNTDSRRRKRKPCSARHPPGQAKGHDIAVRSKRPTSTTITNRVYYIYIYMYIDAVPTPTPPRLLFPEELELVLQLALRLRLPSRSLFFLTHVGCWTWLGLFVTLLFTRPARAETSRACGVCRSDDGATNNVKQRHNTSAGSAHCREPRQGVLRITANLITAHFFQRHLKHRSARVVGGGGRAPMRCDGSHSCYLIPGSFALETKVGGNTPKSASTGQSRQEGARKPAADQ